MPPAITEANDYQPSKFMADKDVAGIDDTDTLTTLMGPELGFSKHSLKGYLVRAAQHRHNMLCRQIVDTLWFRRIDDRKQCISPAHSRTLEWALKPPSTGQKWADLSDWLRCGSGFY